MPVSDKEQQEINTLVARFETASGVQAVAAVVRKADSYPEIPWKAYALGSALGAVPVMLPAAALAALGVVPTLGFHALTILGAGAALATAAALVPAAGRLFLDRLRAQAEARQYAQAMFLEREIFATSGRRALLVFVTRFERVVVILADKGLAQSAPASALDAIAAATQQALEREGVTAAFACAFDALAMLLKANDSPGASRSDEIDDALIVEQGQ